MQEIISYLMEKYDPIGLIIYGSYANKSNNLNSDFDALVITNDSFEYHDCSIVAGTELDVFVYPSLTFESGYDISDYLQIYDGKIVLDSSGIIEKLKKEVNHYIASFPQKTDSENQESIVWCEKMLSRTLRDDVEGLYRLHWLIVDSLEIYCDIRHKFYFGPKKALKELSISDPNGYNLYTQAMKYSNYDNVKNWVEYLKTI